MVGRHAMPEGRKLVDHVSVAQRKQEKEVGETGHPQTPP